VIGAFGGRKKFAELLETTPQAVDNWRRGKRFPANTYVQINILVDAAGDSVPDSLFAMRRRRSRR
jgi:DNA-binding transcriptional regulator YiaG